MVYPSNEKEWLIVLETISISATMMITSLAVRAQPERATVQFRRKIVVEAGAIAGVDPLRRFAGPLPPSPEVLSQAINKLFLGRKEAEI